MYINSFRLLEKSFPKTLQEKDINLGYLQWVMFSGPLLMVVMICILKTKQTTIKCRMHVTHTKLCNIIILIYQFSNWASEASPTLGCLIEISRDIYMLSICRMLYVVCLSYVKLTA